MLVEAGTAVALVIRPPEGVPFSLPLLGLVLLAVVWLSTALLQSPQHSVLGRGFVASSHRFLVASNWVRTVLWTARGLIVLLMTAILLPPA
jgi:apolipoprotein N-acyltransferase